MKQFTFLFAVLSALFCAFIADSSIPAPICYHKKQKCCFKYTSCGYESKTIEKNESCPYNKCENECKKECYPDRRCSNVKVPVGEDCLKKPYGYTFKEVCTPKYDYKKFCYNIDKCQDKCYPKCYNVDANCVKHVQYKYPKYCPQNYCEDLVLSEGNSTAPDPYIASEGTLVKEDPVKRHDA